ncbi:hypothetical protein [Pseudonocardia sp. WMMC193]|uniref:hypothetical protein n=1 Tax=Pseudonocardia sp. WMMC193 TaxID=2911965 RepID=UPI001F234277|nr:hypothetical protein [Pseudonocardia sp. WMMC193]MCF7550490.1 hypothetical protein [Pseudonocardia sp. WMMC193]
MTSPTPDQAQIHAALQNVLTWLRLNIIPDSLVSIAEPHGFIEHDELDPLDLDGLKAALVRVEDALTTVPDPVALAATAIGYGQWINDEGQTYMCGPTARHDSERLAALLAYALAESEAAKREWQMATNRAVGFLAALRHGLPSSDAA